MWRAGEIPCLSFVHAPHPIRHTGAHAKVSRNVVKVRREPGLWCAVGRKNSRLTQFTPRVRQTLSVLRRSHLFKAAARRRLNLSLSFGRKKKIELAGVKNGIKCWINQSLNPRQPGAISTWLGPEKFFFTIHHSHGSRFPWQWDTFEGEMNMNFQILPLPPLPGNKRPLDSFCRCVRIKRTANSEEIYPSEGKDPMHTNTSLK